MDSLYSVSRYLRHRLLGSSPHGVHSPFVFDFFNKVILDKTPYYFYEEIESLRSRLLLDRRIIEVTDLGTGGYDNRNRNLRISYIAKHFLQSKKNAQLISRIITYFKPEFILELGTSLGITSTYLAKPDKKSKLITLEGCAQTAAIATENFQLLRIKNIEQIIGEFSQSLPSALSKFKRVDFVYFDGNHTKDATLKYFDLCLKNRHEQSIFVFDDIHWNREMTEAWIEIQNYPEVTFTIDLFEIGIVFFRTGIPKQHFKLKY